MENEHKLNTPRALVRRLYVAAALAAGLGGLVTTVQQYGMGTALRYAPWALALGAAGVALSQWRQARSGRARPRRTATAWAVGLAVVLYANALPFTWSLEGYLRVCVVVAILYCAQESLGAAARRQARRATA